MRLSWRQPWVTEILWGYLGYWGWDKKQTPGSQTLGLSLFPGGRSTPRAPAVGPAGLNKPPVRCLSGYAVPVWPPTLWERAGNKGHGDRQGSQTKNDTAGSSGISISNIQIISTHRCNSKPFAEILMGRTERELYYWEREDYPLERSLLYLK